VICPAPVWHDDRVGRSRRDGENISSRASIPLIPANDRSVETSPPVASTSSSAPPSSPVWTVIWHLSWVNEWPVAARGNGETLRMPYVGSGAMSLIVAIAFLWAAMETGLFR
jgi:hypothetical protein